MLLSLITDEELLGGIVTLTAWLASPGKISVRHEVGVNMPLWNVMLERWTVYCALGFVNLTLTEPHAAGHPADVRSGVMSPVSPADTSTVESVTLGRLPAFA